MVSVIHYFRVPISKFLRIIKRLYIMFSWFLSIFHKHAGKPSTVLLIKRSWVFKTISKWNFNFWIIVYRPKASYKRLWYFLYSCRIISKASADLWKVFWWSVLLGQVDFFKKPWKFRKTIDCKNQILFGFSCHKRRKDKRIFYNDFFEWKNIQYLFGLVPKDLKPWNRPSRDKSIFDCSRNRCMDFLG